VKSRLINLLKYRRRNTLYGGSGSKTVKTENGFTLLELLVVLPIVSVLMGVMAMTTIMIMKVGPQNNNHVIVLTQVQNAGYWVTRDAMNGQVIIPGTYGDGVLVNIAWDEWDGTNNEIDDTLSDGQLLRQKNGGASVIVARYIVANDTFFIEDPSNESKYIFTVKASLGTTEIEKEYDVSRRLPEGE
jgi:prepilin-type N-terminal cleavage/methylation domain-containing protein